MDSIASAYAILANNNAAKPPLLNATQLFNSPVDSFAPCSPSCPATALEYVADISSTADGLREDGGTQTVGSSQFASVIMFIVHIFRSGLYPTTLGGIGRGFDHNGFKDKNASLVFILLTFAFRFLGSAFAWYVDHFT